MYNDLPPSVEFIRKKKQQPFDFLGSMLWTVYESCGSWCLSKVLSRPARIAELFKHMLMTGSEKTSVLSSRILRHVVPSQHSPQTIALIWDSLETKRITYGLSQNARKSLVHALFGLIGVRKTWLYRSTVLKNLERWELEAHDFLRSLINEERWKEEIISVMLEELGNLGADISSG